VKALIARGANVNQADDVSFYYSYLRVHLFVFSHDQDGKTPVYAAAGSGHEGTVKELIARGARIHQADKVSTTIMFISNNIFECIY
jgi:ankyrin repeat protein